MSIDLMIQLGYVIAAGLFIFGLKMGHFGENIFLGHRTARR